MRLIQRYLIRAYFIVFVWAVLTSIAGAQSDHYAEARKTVQGLVSEVFSNLKKFKNLYEKSEADYRAHVREVIYPAIAFDLSSRVILGSHWKSASSEQKAHFSKALESMLINGYGKVLLVLDNPRVEFIDPPATTGSEKKQVIQTQLIASDGVTRLDYVVIKHNGRWLIFDLIVDGLSLVKQLRQSFNKEIEEGGLDALIERLRVVK